MKGVLAMVAALAAVASVSASNGPTEDVASRARGAGRVVVAQVVDVQPRFDVNEYGDRLIVSQAVVSVEESLKGPHSSVVLVDFEGGSIGGLSLNVSDMPSLKHNDRAVFFLESTPTRTGAYRLRRRGLGVMRLDSANRILGNGMTLDQVRAAVRGAAR